MRRFVCLAALATVTLAACADVGIAPSGPRLPSTLESSAMDGPFRVVHHTPEGAVAAARQVTLFFSRPVGCSTWGCAPAEVVDDEGTRVPGAWTWHGRLAVFTPKARALPLATRFRVEVRDLLAEGGASLGPERSFAFATAGPSLQTVEYVYDADKRAHLLTAHFDQDVAPAEAARHLRLEGQLAGAKVALPLGPVDTEAGSTLTFHVPTSVASRITAAEVTCSPGLAPASGKLGSAALVRLPLEGLTPLTAKLECHSEPPAPCDWSSAAVVFSKPIRSESLWPRLRVGGRPIKQPPSGSDDRVWLNDVLEIAPSRSYRVTIGAGVVADDGDVLAAPFSLDVKIPPLAPAIELPGLGGDPVVPVDRSHDLPLRLWSVNVPEIHLTAAPVAAAEMERILGEGPDAAAIPVPSGPPVAVALSRPTAKRDEDAAATVGATSFARAPGAPGLYSVVAEGAGARAHGVVTFTDLGVTTITGDGRTLAWVTRLSTGAPVEGARVWLAGRGGDLRTDARGLAELAIPDDGKPHAALVAAGGDFVYARTPATGREQRLRGYVFPDRRLYRPGESVILKGYVRVPTSRGYVPAVAELVEVRGADAAGKPFFSGSTRTDAFGSFSLAVPTSSEMAQGHATVEASLPGAQARAPAGRGRARGVGLSTSVYVTEFRPVDTKVETSFEHDEATVGGRAALRVRGRYLFGGPVKNAPFSWDCTRVGTTFTPKGLEGYDTWLAAKGTAAAGTSASGTGRLGEGGTASAEVPLDNPGQVGPERLKCTVSVDDPHTHLSMGADAEVLVHGADVYLGVRTEPSSTVWDGRPLDAYVRAASPKGEPRQVPVRVELTDAAESRVVGSCDVVTGATDAKCTFRPAAAGTYVVRAIAADGSGRPVWAGRRVNVQRPTVSPAEDAARVAREARAAVHDARSAPPPAPPLSFAAACVAPAKPERRVSLTAEHESVPAGGKARLCLRAPVGAQVLITAEREGVRSSTLRRQSAPAELFDFDVEPALFPNVRLSAYAVLAGKEHGYPGETSSHVHLDVASEATNLAVALDVPPVTAPGAEIEVGARVASGSGAPVAGAQVTLWAVDEGVDSLMPMPLPEPGPTFHARMDVDAHATDTRARLFRDMVSGGRHSVRAPSIRQGATSVGARTMLSRRKILPLAFHLPDLVSDAGGRVSAKVTMPHNTTTFRVMAVVAHGSHGFGQAEGKLRATQEAVIRPLVPRFLRAGDAVLLGASVHAEGEDRGSLTLETSGSLTGRGVSPIVTGEDADVARFGVTARAPGLGGLKLLFRGRAADSLELPLMVRDDPPPLDAVVFGGAARPRAVERLVDLSAATGGAGGLTLRLSTSPVAGLAQGFEELVEYPYGCTEQTSSRLLPLVSLRALAPALGVAMPADADREAARAVSRLSTHQRDDGGFGFWPESRSSTPWLTLIALDALVAAKRAGYTVPEEVLERARAFLAAAAAAGKLTPLERGLHAGHGGDAAAVARDATLPLHARALALVALAKASPEEARGIARALASTVESRGDVARVEPAPGARGLEDSRVVASSALLLALVAADPDHALVAPLARGLLTSRVRGRYRSTHDAGWALRALAAVAGARPPAPARVEVKLDGARLTDVTLGPGAIERSVEVPMARLRGGRGELVIESSGAPVAYDGVVRYALAGPRRSVERGLLLERVVYVQTTGAGVVMRPLGPAAPIAIGQYVETEIIVATPTDRTQVIVEDPLFAGVEPLRDDLALLSHEGAASARGPFTRYEVRDDKVVFFFDDLPAGVHRVSYRARATAAGRFSAPETTAACMYDPTVVARTAPRSVEVR
ncbi:MAG: hypothetical protein JNL38_11245 [Myxococcales bacterium]|nr:hypothetical protein [Myxococcales bacterium]